MNVFKLVATIGTVMCLISPVALAQISGEGGPIRVNADRSEVLERERKMVLIDNVDITQGTARQIGRASCRERV